MKNRHERWTDQLSEYLDEELEGERLRSMEEHLSACEACQGVLRDLRALRDEARGLGESQPRRDLWPGIAEALARTPRDVDVIALPVGAARPTPPPRGLGVFLTVRQLAAAAVVLISMSAAGTWWAGVGVATRSTTTLTRTSESPVMPAAAVGPSPEMADELEALEATLAEARGRLDPNTVRILEKNLGVIQRAIDESVQALAVDPGNAFLLEHLERAYREKADFLRDAASLADWEG